MKPNIKQSFQMGLGMRLGLTILALIAFFLYPHNQPDLTPGYTVQSQADWIDRLLGVWANWDGLWYLRSADEGYQSNLQSLAFFPLYPSLVSVLGLVTAGNLLLSANLLSFALTIVALSLFQSLCQADFGDEITAKAVSYLLFFPTAFYLFAVCTESLFMPTSPLSIRTSWPASP